jgi:NAD(P)H-quinone oxidoreductase subunit 5
VIDPVLSNAYWIVAAPFLAAIIIILFARFNKTLSMLLSVGAVAYGFFHSLAILNVLRVNPTPYQTNIDWFVSSSFKLSVGLLVDNLAAVMLIVVTTVSLLVQIYTHGYMREDPGYSRFYAYLSLFTGSMLGLVVSTNLFQMYMFWELVGVCSYFLIGFWYYKVSAAEACLKAFVVNRIGDFGFLVGILLFLNVTYGFWQGHSLLMFSDPNGFDLTGAIHWAVANSGLTAAGLTVIALIMFMGPMAKSAQAPLHVWLPDAMEGPTPISALIHAATMVAAGVYLVARAYPVFLTPDGHTQSTALAVVAWIGGFTAIMAATIAMSQFDIKRVLAWSTVSQLGYMFVGLGTGAYTAGMFHLFNHAFFKAMLFLCSGAVIHGLHGEQDIRKMGGLRKTMPITFVCFLIGTISISGVPLFSGFFSKDAIIDSANHFSTGPLAGLLGPLMLFTAFLTAFYMFRLLFMTFFGKYRGEAHPHESPWVMTAPLMVLAVPSVLSGYLGVNPQALFGGATQALPNAFTAFLHFGPTAEYEALNFGGMTISTIFALTGIGLAFLVYMRGLALNTWFEKKLPVLYQFSFNKWYFDDVYMFLVQKVILPTFRAVWSLVDQRIIDNIVNLTGLGALGSGEVLRYSENGRGQYYAMVIFACVAGLSLVFYVFGR